MYVWTDDKGASASEKRLAKKPTKFMSSSPHMLKQLEFKCDRSHFHQILEGSRCADAAFYPIELVRAILKRIQGTTEAEKHRHAEFLEERKKLAALVCAARKAEPVAKESGIIGKTKVKKLGGGTLDIDFDLLRFKAQYFDEYTGGILPNDLVRAAMIEEMTFISPGRLFGQPPSGRI